MRSGHPHKPGHGGSQQSHGGLKLDLQTLLEVEFPPDTVLLSTHTLFSGCLVAARVIGLFHMQGQGANDCKVLAVPHADPLFQGYQDLDHAPRAFLRETEYFFQTYKQLEGAAIATQGWRPAGGNGGGSPYYGALYMQDIRQKFNKKKNIPEDVAEATCRCIGRGKVWYVGGNMAWYSGRFFGCP